MAITIKNLKDWSLLRSGLQRGVENVYILGDDLDFNEASEFTSLNQRVVDHIVIEGNKKHIRNLRGPLFQSLGPNVKIQNLNIDLTQRIQGSALICEASNGGIFDNITVIAEGTGFIAPLFGVIRAGASTQLSNQSFNGSGPNPDPIPDLDQHYFGFIAAEVEMSGGNLEVINCSVQNYNLYQDNGGESGLFIGYIENSGNDDIVFSGNAVNNVTYESTNEFGGFVCNIENYGEGNISFGDKADPDAFNIVEDCVFSSTSSIAGFVNRIISMKSTEDEPYGNVLFYNCQNLNTDVLSENESAAGICNEIELTGNLDIEDCCNSGNITASVEVGSVEGSCGLFGSITAGRYSDYAHILTFTNCYNKGHIVGGTASGIFGFITSGNEDGKGSVQISELRKTGEIDSLSNSAGIILELRSYSPDKNLVSNCHNEGKVTAYDEGSAAGIAGIFWCTNVMDCTNSGLISGPDYAAGIVQRTWSYNEGFFGYTAHFEILNCTNSGEIRFFSLDPDLPCGIYGGGIAALTMYNTVIQACTNEGDVINFISSGGIVGVFIDYGTQIISCINLSSQIVGDTYAGGILGGWTYGSNSRKAIRGITTMEFNFPLWPTKIVDCVSCGKVKTLSEPYMADEMITIPSAGGIIGTTYYAFYGGSPRIPSDGLFQVSGNKFIGSSVSSCVTCHVGRIVGDFLMGYDVFFENEANPTTKLTGTDMGTVSYQNRNAESYDRSNIWNGKDLQIETFHDLKHRYCIGWDPIVEKISKRCE
jgi:hypothetical protein